MVAPHRVKTVTAKKKKKKKFRESPVCIRKQENIWERHGNGLSEVENVTYA